MKGRGARKLRRDGVGRFSGIAAMYNRKIIEFPMRTDPPRRIWCGILQVLFPVIYGHRIAQPRRDSVGSEPFETPPAIATEFSFSPEWRGAGRSIFCQPISKLADGDDRVLIVQHHWTRALMEEHQAGRSTIDCIEAQKVPWNPGSEVIFVDATEQAEFVELAEFAELDAEELSDEYFTLEKYQVDPALRENRIFFMGVDYDEDDHCSILPVEASVGRDRVLKRTNFFDPGALDAGLFKIKRIR